LYKLSSGAIKDANQREKQLLDSSRLSEKRKSSSSLEFLANLFSSNTSNSRRSSKSPTKPLPTPHTSTNPILKLFRSKSQESNQQQLSKSPVKTRPDMPCPEPAATNVQDIIRSELKKIVQLQHDTVMSFLNNGQVLTPPAHTNYNTQNSISQQMRSIFQQQSGSGNVNGQPVEFVIETKVKTIDSQGRVAYTDMAELATKGGSSNCFMKEFAAADHHTPRSRAVDAGGHKKSSFIKIPLLTSGAGGSGGSPVRFPVIDSGSRQQQKQQHQQRLGLTLLDFESRQREVNESRVNVEGVRENIKSARVKNVRDFPLLKLNYNGGRGSEDLERKRYEFEFFCLISILSFS